MRVFLAFLEMVVKICQELVGFVLEVGEFFGGE